jgi:hypothetical protein
MPRVSLNNCYPWPLACKYSSSSFPCPSNKPSYHMECLVCYLGNICVQLGWGTLPTSLIQSLAKGSDTEACECNVSKAFKCASSVCFLASALGTHPEKRRLSEPLPFCVSPQPRIQPAYECFITTTPRVSSLDSPLSPQHPFCLHVPLLYSHWADSPPHWDLQSLSPSIRIFVVSCTSPPGALVRPAFINSWINQTASVIHLGVHTAQEYHTTVLTTGTYIGLWRLLVLT